MRKINNKVALIEYGGSHTECMYTQIKALIDKGYKPFLICNKSLVDRFSDLSVFTDVLLLHDVYDKLKIREKLEDIRKIRHFLKKYNINSIVINTLEHKRLKPLLLLPFPRVKNYIAIVHDGSYIKRSTTFKWQYRRIKKILVLSENIVKNVEKYPRNIQLRSFYPIFFPTYSYLVNKPKDEFWITIPGAMISTHRDIIHLLGELKKKALYENIKIIFLGSIEKSIRQNLENLLKSGNKNIVLFEGHISQEIFDAYMRNTDIVLPLIMQSYYGNYRISGTYNLAYGYQKPMLLSKNIQLSNEDFIGISLSYDKDEIIEILNSISNKSEKLIDLTSKYNTHPFLTVEKQCEIYIQMLEK